MPDSRFTSPHAAASHTLVALERYQARVRKLAGSWTDMDLYRAVGEDIDEVRQGCREVYALSGPWVELLISHAELVQSLWQSSRPGAPMPPAERQLLVEKVGANVLALEQACMRLMKDAPPS